MLERKLQAQSQPDARSATGDEKPQMTQVEVQALKEE